MSVEQRRSPGPPTQPTETIRRIRIRTRDDVLVDIATQGSASSDPRQRAAATVDTFARERAAEDALLALLAQGTREAADSQRMRILRARSAREVRTEVSE